MNQPPSFNLRQMLEAMPLIFNPAAYPDLRATIQFNITGAEPGIYNLDISDGRCVFHNGTVPNPTLAINAPSDIWLGIMQGRISGQEAFMQGRYTAQGDFSLLQKWGELFKHGGDRDMRAPRAQRLPGPIALSGAAWMAVAFAPWILHWLTYNSFGISPLISVGLPFVLSALIVGYRLIFNRPDWLESGGLVFFTLGGVLSLEGSAAFHTWGSIWSNLFLGCLWLVSLLVGKEPLSMQYIKWQFDRKLWGFSLFIYIHAAVSLVWGYQSILAATFGTIGTLLPSASGVFTIFRYLTLVPAYFFTAWYPKTGLQHPVKDSDSAMRTLQLVSAAGVIVAAILFMASILHK
jgi:putative sterol carrier protein